MKKRICCIFSFVILFLSFNNVYATENHSEFILNEDEAYVINDDNFYEKREEYAEIINDNVVSKNNKQPSPSQLFKSQTSYDKNEIIDYIVEESRKNVSDAKLCQRQDGSITKPINFYDISKYNLSEVEAYALALECYERPEMFYAIQLGLHQKTASGHIAYIYVEYYMTQEEIDSEFAILDKEVNKYKKGINSNWNDLEKILYTNNYVCSLLQYNYDEAYKEINGAANTEINYRVHKLNGGLIDKSPVCDGYARTLNYLLSSININSSIVSSEEMCHAWSLVQLNNKYYHLDVTWNDLGNYGKNSYEYFLLSDYELEDREHYSYFSWELANDFSYDNYNMVWNKTENYLIYNSGYWYYLDNYGGNIPSKLPVKELRLNKFDIKNNKLISTKTIDIGAFGDEIYFAPGLTQKGNKLCFSTNTKFYYMDLDGTNIRIVHTAALSDSEYLYSVEYTDNKFYYNSVKLDSSVNIGYRILSNSFIPVESIKLNKNELNLFINEPQTIKATVLPSNTTDNVSFTWKSSDEKIATVDSNGKITGLKKGNAVITVSYSGLSTSCNVSVIDKLPFPDVSTSAWYYEPIKFNYVNKIILGFGDGYFKPNTKLTRGMLVTLLHRMEGEPLPKTSGNVFKDVKSTAYYSNAVKWAKENGIVTGYEPANLFKPDNNITRQDFACILSNYAQYKNIYVKSNIKLNNFIDTSNVSGYALDKIKWAVENKIIRGKGDKLAPKDTTTRAEAAAMISNYFEAFK